MKFKLLLLMMLSLLSTQAFALYGAHPAAHDRAAQAVVSLHLNDAHKPKYNYFCSGVLVTPTRVLTTGHCIALMGREAYTRWSMFVYQPQLIKVRINGVDHAVADVNLAPTYTEDDDFHGEDLAMIDLVKPAKVKPVKLAVAADLKPGKKVRLIARGKEARSTIIDNRVYGDHRVLFTDGTMAGVCQGDSGGALLIEKGGEYVLAGILSAHETGCTKASGIAHFPKTEW